MLRAPNNNRLGTVVVDLGNGNIWAFPTLTQAAPYPIDATGSTQLPTSHPLLLGKFESLPQTNRSPRGGCQTLQRPTTPRRYIGR
jgi:hypothetical protein